MKKLFRLAFLLMLLVMGILMATAPVVADEGDHVTVIDFSGAVTAPLADYIERGITEAEKSGAQACIITMNTPGGLLSSTETIVNRITNADVPVVVYVESWAGSAGTFVTICSHIAAMAPGSNIGAASPVSGTGDDIPDTMQKKVTEHTAAWAESLAEERGRNKMAARAAVQEAASYTVSEALGKDEVEDWERLGLDGPILDPPLVDLSADNLADLMRKIDGWEVTLRSGETRVISTTDASVVRVDRTTIERFLMAISDSNIAYILLSVASLGILIEILHPGLIFPGVAGIISLFLGVYSLDMLEANWAGILLIVAAFIMFVAEALTSTFGLLLVGGVISLVLGSFILFSGSPFSLDPALIAGVTIFFTSIAAFLVISIVRAHKLKITTGREGLIDETGIASTLLDPEGMVRIKGERWRARAEDDRIEPGEQVVVTKIERMSLWVKKKSDRRNG